MNNVRPSGPQKFPEISVGLLNGKAVTQLLGHQRFAVTHCHDLAVLDSLDLRRMGIGDFAAPYDGNLKHCADHAQRSENNAAIRPLSEPWVPNLVSSSVSHCYIVSSSSMRAIAFG